MASNLIENVKVALKHCNIRSITGWTDNTVILHWLNRQGLYKQFVANRVTKILEKEYIKWYYVPTKQNPADIGSRGSLLSKIPDIWWKGPSWIAENSKWPDQPILSESKASEKEAKIILKILATTVKLKDLFDLLLDKYELHKLLRVSAWLTRFISNCRKIKKTEPLTTSEIQYQEIFYIKREQRKVEHSGKFEESRKQLNLQLNCEGINEF